MGDRMPRPPLRRRAMTLREAHAFHRQLVAAAALGTPSPKGPGGWWNDSKAAGVLMVAVMCACLVGLSLLLALGCATRPCETDPHAQPPCPDVAVAPPTPDMAVAHDLCPSVVYEVCEPQTAECFPCPDDAGKFCRVVPCVRGDL